MYDKKMDASKIEASGKNFIKQHDFCSNYKILDFSKSNLKYISATMKNERK